jgi:hypothetical protein
MAEHDPILQLAGNRCGCARCDADREAAIQEEREAEAFVSAQWKAADEWLADEWPHATDSERAVVRSAWTEQASRAGDELTAMKARKDGAYEERNRVVAALARLFPSGVARTAIEGWAEEWHGCVYIDTPVGQMSWHFHDSHAHLFAGLPSYQGSWDGHDTPEKYRRLAALAPTAAQDEMQLQSKDGFHADPVEDIAFALAFELEHAALNPKDEVTLNRDKLRGIARRVLAKAAQKD